MKSLKSNSANFGIRTLILTCSAVLLTIVAGKNWLNWQDEQYPVTTQQTTSINIDKQIPAKDLKTQVYWVRVDDDQIGLVPEVMNLQQSQSTESALRQALNLLLSQPKNPRLVTTIPDKTRLLSLRVNQTEIHVNLSREFSQGGGTNSMVYRVAQVLYTVTSLDPRAKVFLYVEGQPINEKHPLGGEGIILKQPTTRQNFNEDFSIN
jgi:spore germination protein GerM